MVVNLRDTGVFKVPPFNERILPTFTLNDVKGASAAAGFITNSLLFSTVIIKGTVAELSDVKLTFFSFYPEQLLLKIKILSPDLEKCQNSCLMGYYFHLQ